MSKVIIYHHNDDDGFCSGALVYEYLKNYLDIDPDQIETCKIDYTMKLDFTNIKKDDLVYFVDYSFSNDDNIEKFKELIKRMNDGDGHIYWFDHHKTSQELINELKKEKDPILESKNFDYIINLNDCATVICYKYLSKKFKMYSNEVKLPTLLQYIDSYDSWKHNMPDTDEFHLGMIFKNNNIYEYFDEILPIGSNIFDYEIDLTRSFTMKCIDHGRSIKPYAKIQNENLINRVAFNHTFICEDRRLKALVCNCTGGSNTFGDNIDKYDLLVAFIYNGEQYQYSLYSNKDYVDCSTIAEYLGEVFGLGGGGHKGAAGFQSLNNAFKKNGSTMISIL